MCVCVMMRVVSDSFHSIMSYNLLKFAWLVAVSYITQWYLNGKHFIMVHSEAKVNVYNTNPVADSLKA